MCPIQWQPGWNVSTAAAPPPIGAGGPIRGTYIILLNRYHKFTNFLSPTRLVLFSTSITYRCRYRILHHVFLIQPQVLYRFMFLCIYRSTLPRDRASPPLLPYRIYIHGVYASGDINFLCTSTAAESRTLCYHSIILLLGIYIAIERPLLPGILCRSFDRSLICDEPSAGCYNRPTLSHRL